MTEPNPPHVESENRLLPNIAVGVLAGFVALNYTIIYGLIIFTGSVPDKAASGMGLALLSGLVLSLLVAVFGKVDALISYPQSDVAPVVILLTTQIAQDMAGQPAEIVFLTIVAALIVAGLLTGAGFYLFGKYDLGNLVRFMPYPVVGGFLAGLGWLLVLGSVKVSVGESYGMAALLTPEKIRFWLPSILFGLLVLIVQRKSKNYLILPAMLIGGFVLFYGVMFALGYTTDQMMAEGWLLGRFSDGSMLQFPSLRALRMADWGVVAAQSGTLLTVLFTALLTSLLYFSGIELVTRENIDVNHELRVTGVANAVVGLGGGLVGYPSASVSLLAHQAGGRGRTVGLVTALMFGLILLFGNDLIAFLPRPIISSMWVFVGSSFIVRWVVESWNRLPRADYLVLLSILGTIIAFGLLPGVAVGLVIMVILFVINYSQIPIVRNTLSGETFRSNVARSPHYQDHLAGKGQQTMFLKLQGFIFFGTAYRLQETVRARVFQDDLSPLKYLVLDFRLINGVDSSAMSSFASMARLAKSEGITLIFSEIAPDLLARIQKVLQENGEKPALVFADLDSSAEWCEEQCLAATNATIESKTRIARQLLTAFQDANQVEEFIAYLNRETHPANTTLIEQGTPPQAIYFIEEGKVTAQINGENGKMIRLRTMGSGTTVGEMGVYLDIYTSAKVIIEEPTVFYVLSISQMKKMAKESPALAAAFHQYMVKIVSARLLAMNQTVQALMD